MIGPVLVLILSLLSPSGGGPAQSGTAGTTATGTAASPVRAAAAAIGTALIGGNISQAQLSYGPRYLAVRAPRGTLVRICAATCVVMPSTDYGPSSKIRPRRIADLALVVWRTVCGLPDERGLCRGSVEFLGRTPVPPATDTAP